MQITNKPLSGFGYLTPNEMPPKDSLRTISGTPPLTVTNAKAAMPQSITIYGNTVDGVGVGDLNERELYDIPLTFLSKNLLDYNNIFQYTTGVSDNYLISYGAITLKPHTAYTCSSDIPGDATVANVFVSTEPEFSTVNNGFGSYSHRTVITDESGILYLAVRKTGTDLLCVTLDDLSNGKYYIQVEEGTDPTSYEPYYISHQNVVITDKPLASSDFIVIKPQSKTAVRHDNSSNIRKNISHLQNWDEFVPLSIYSNIITVDTTVHPSTLKISYRV